MLYKVDRRLQEARLSRISLDDFQSTDHQTILRLLQESVDQDMAEPLNYVLNSLSLPMMEVADGLLARTDKLDPNDDRVLSYIVQTLLDVRDRRLHQSNEHLQYLIEDAQREGDLKATQYRQIQMEYANAKYLIHVAKGRYTSRVLSKG
jgi:hypothetical protein